MYVCVVIQSRSGSVPPAGMADSLAGSPDATKSMTPGPRELTGGHFGTEDAHATATHPLPRKASRLGQRLVLEVASDDTDTGDEVMTESTHLTLTPMLEYHPMLEAGPVPAAGSSRPKPTLVHLNMRHLNGGTPARPSPLHPRVIHVAAHDDGDVSTPTRAPFSNGADAALSEVLETDGVDSSLGGVDEAAACVETAATVT